MTKIKGGRFRQSGSTHRLLRLTQPERQYTFDRPYMVLCQLDVERGYVLFKMLDFATAYDRETVGVLGQHVGKSN